MIETLAYSIYVCMSAQLHAIYHPLCHWEGLFLDLASCPGYCLSLSTGLTEVPRLLHLEELAVLEADKSWTRASCQKRFVVVLAQASATACFKQ